MPSCTRDDDCRTDDGDVCDPAWHACVLPNLAAIVPATAIARPRRPRDDASFGPSDQVSTAASGAYQLEPSAALTDDGPAVIYASFDRTAATSTIGVSHDRTLASGGARDLDPRLARDRAGKLYAVWQAGDPGRERSCSRRPPIAARPGPRRPPSTIPTTAPARLRRAFAEPTDRDPGPDPAQRTRDRVYLAYVAGGQRAPHPRLVTTAARPSARTATALPGGDGGLAVDPASTGGSTPIALSDTTGESYGSAQHQLAYHRSRSTAARRSPSRSSRAVATRRSPRGSRTRAYRPRRSTQVDLHRLRARGPRHLSWGSP